MHAVGDADLQHFWLAEALLLAAGRVCGNFCGVAGHDRVEQFGTESGNPACANCMVHSGYEASAVHATFSSLSGFLATVKATLFSRYKDDGALRLLDEHVQPVHGFVPVQNITSSAEETQTV